MRLIERITNDGYMAMVPATVLDHECADDIYASHLRMAANSVTLTYRIIKNIVTLAVFIHISSVE